MNALKIFITLLICLPLLWWLSAGVRTDAVYDSVHNVGYRVGMVLPQGYDIGSELQRDQAVRLRPVSFYSGPERMPASIRARVVEERARNSHELVAPIIMLVCVVGAMLISIRLYQVSGRRLDRWHDRVTRAFMLLMATGMLITIVFMLSRVFWTGVDDAFIARSTQVNPNSPSVHVLGSTTLSMNQGTLIMLYLAIVLTAFPLMVLIATRAMGDWSSVRSQLSSSRVANKANGVLSHPLIRARFNLQSSMGVAMICYVLVTLVLWSAPWSTTLARALWS